MRVLSTCVALLCVFAPGLSAQRWTGSLDGNAFGTWTAQSSRRGSTGIGASAWSIGTLVRESAVRLELRGMVGLDPLVPGECGQPRLFTGVEGVCGEYTAADRLHPHPLFMELSAGVSRQMGGVALSVRAGPVGEPALGPPSWLHRGSAQLDPVIPLTALDMNPAHVAHGFATASVMRGAWRAEASWFNASDGDEDAYDFDVARPQSWSARVQYDAGPGTRVQISAATMEPPAHGAHAGHDVAGRLRVMSASLVHERTAGAYYAQTAAAWSRSRLGGTDTDALLLEVRGERAVHALTARAEYLERIQVEHSFGPIASDGSHDHFIIDHHTRTIETGAGYSVRVADAAGLEARAGVRAALTFLPEYNRTSYGATRVRTITVHVQLRRAAAHMHMH